MSFAESSEEIAELKFSPFQTYSKHEPFVMVNLGNDIIGIQGTQSDRYLSNNINVAVVTENVPEFLKKLMSQSPQTSYMLVASQYLYTPENLDSKEIVKNDRPYAGWLFTRIQSTDRKQNYLIISGIEVGVVGPASGASQIQKLVHQLTGSSEPSGWKNQLNNELGVNVYHMRALSFRRDSKYIDHELVAHAGASIGNVNTHMQTGLLYRIGYNIPDDMGAAFITADEMAQTGTGDNSLIGPAPTSDRMTVYFFMGADTRLVARDIFLDGNTFSSSHSVEKENSIWGLKYGIVIGRKNFEVGFANVITSDRFNGQREKSHNGMIFFRYKGHFL